MLVNCYFLLAGCCRCVEELRSALVQAEELGMAKANLVVVAASTELLQRFPVESNSDCEGQLRDNHGVSDASDDNHTDIGYDIGVLSCDDETSSGDGSDSCPVSVCDTIDSNNMASVMSSDVSKSDILAHYRCTKHENSQIFANTCQNVRIRY